MKNYLFGENHGLDDKSIEFISKAIEKANLPGFDYLEFRMAVDNLKKMDLDEATSFKSAFAILVRVNESISYVSRHQSHQLNSEENNPPCRFLHLL